jgi:hypothetical protein
MSSTPPPHDLEALVSRGRALLAAGQALDAVHVFADAYASAVASGAPSTAAQAMLGQAQGEFALHRLELAARHADTAVELLNALAAPQARHAMDLVAQIEHYRYLS